MLKTMLLPAIMAGLAAACAPWAADAPAAVTSAALTDSNDADPALFVVEDEDTTLYLFGTVHLLRPDIVWFDDAVKDAFDASDRLIIEAPEPAPEEAQRLVMLGIDPAGTPLSETLSPDAYAELEAILAEFGVPPTQFEAFDPWLVGINLAGLQFRKLGMSPDTGAEKVLLAAAAERNLPVSGFETAAQQMRLFDDMSEADQVRFLEEGLDEFAESETMITRMMDAWRTGDMTALAALMNEGMTDPALRARLLTDRNANWAVQIDELLDAPGTIFIAVGAGHLGGEGSVQDYLAQRGISVRRVDY
ncbi:MAG: TraB/GumN family protein [Pacificimonas sp.]|jgi:uncharacterized protein YbaP (TraB family)|nr:TraB/GumN family protein [Pacificimonas sp.]